MLGETVAAPMLMLAAPDATRSPFVDVAVHTDPAAVADAWAALETERCSIYQTRAWMLPWLATLGRRARLSPRFVLATTRDKRPAALLCLGFFQHGPFTVATWLGGKDSNCNLPLLADELAWSASDVHRFFREAARACGSARPDIFVLSNQPFAWRGKPNPFTLLAHRVSPSAAYGARLPPDAETLLAAKLSKEARKKLRKKEMRLARSGPLTHWIATDPSGKAKILKAFLAQKLERFRRQGITSEFDTTEMQTFLRSASAPNGHGIELHALSVGARIVAIYGGAAHAGHWSGMFNSFDLDEEIARSSPGELLLMRIVEKACADGLTSFDLGIGEARYKSALCDETIALFDLLVPITFAGRIYAAALGARQDAKRFVKRSPLLYALAKRVRTRLPRTG